MIGISRQFLICMLVLTVGHVPLPCVHNHDNLASAEFLQHAACYHSQQFSGCSVSGWHFHWMPLDSGTGIPAAAVRLAKAPALIVPNDEDLAEGLDLDGLHFQRSQLLILFVPAASSLSTVGWADASAQETFQKLCVLRL